MGRNFRSVTLATVVVFWLAWLAQLISTPLLLAGAAAWQREWDKTLAVASQEGKVVVMGPPGEISRKAFSEAFQKAFPKITVEYSGGWGPAHVPKLVESRKAGRNIADVYISGPQPGLQSLKDTGFFQPLEQALILPEIKKPDNWWRGKLDFIDKEGKFYLAFWAFPVEPFMYNTEKVKVEEIKSWWDLVNPRFNGKIGMYDPLIPGSMVPKLNHFFHEPMLGERYIQALLSPDFGAVSTRDDRQLAEWVGRGTYLIGIGASWLTAAPLTKVLPLQVFPSDKLKEGTLMTSGFGNVALLTGAPNLNAAKVYINWLLSREGQTEVTRITENPSGRVDVSQELVPDLLRRRGQTQYFMEYYEKVTAGRVKALAVANKVMGR